MVAKNSFFSLARLKEFGFEYLVTGVFAPLPTPIGSLIRNAFYRLILKEIGAGVYLAPGVQLIGTKHIQLHQHARARKGVFIQSFGNPITLKQGVQIGRYGAIRSFKGHGGSIEIGENTSLGFYTIIGGPGKISIGKHCLIASHVSMHANNHNYGEIDVPIGKQGMTCKGITIEDNCWIGAGARILDGVTIGKGSVIGAGAVVNKDVSPYSVAVGVPAKVVKHYAPTNQPVEEAVSMPRSNYELTTVQFSDPN